MGAPYVQVVVNGSNPKAHAAMEELAAHLEGRGLAQRSCLSQELPMCAAASAREGDGCELVVVLGGDGTILRASRLAEQLDAPILGINFGHLGFLANPCTESVAAMVDDALAGRARVEERANLAVTVRDDAGERSCFALNEVVVRSASGHIVDLDLDVAGERVAAMRADGMVVATATGSTAYALSAGGPLVSPAYQGLVVVPLAPHTLTSRALCTEHDEVVEVVVKGRPGPGEVAVFLDGDAFPLEGGLQSLSVRPGERPTRLLQVSAEGFYRRVAEVFFH